MSFPVVSEHNQRKMSHTKKDVGMGLSVQCLYALSLHLVSVVYNCNKCTNFVMKSQKIFLGLTLDKAWWASKLLKT